MMISEELRQSVLQAAMQGKLTEQHPEEEGYAIDLLNQIQEEKKHLVKEGKIKKQPKTKPIMEDEIPFDIPDNWIWARLVNIAKVEMGSSPKGEFIHKGGKGKEFHQGKIYFGKTNLLYSNLKTDKITRCAHSGDILLCVRAPIGEINFTDRDICIGRGLSAISGYSKVSQKYLFYCLKAFKQDLILKGTGSTFKAITANVVKDQLIPLPPLAEQHRIVEKLDELMEQIDELEKSEKKLEKLEKEFPEDMKASLLQAAMQGKLTKQLKEDGNADDLLKVISEERAKLVKEKKIKKSKPLPQISEDEIPFDIPDNWRWVRFGNILNIVSAKRVHKSDWQKSGIPFYRAREIAKLAKDNQVDNDLFISEELFDELSKYGIPEPNDLMVTGVGTLGKTYIVKSNDKFYYKDASVLCMKNYGHISSDYIKSVMESPYMQKEIKKSSSGTTVGTLTIIRLSNYLFPLPPLAEQHRIVKKLDELLPLCETLKED